MKILIASPIRQKPKVLKYFLKYITLQEYIENSYGNEDAVIDYYFVDDNDNTSSKRLLEKFKIKNCCVVIDDETPKRFENLDINYDCNDYTHVWKDELIWKVAYYKNQIIKYAKEKEYDYLFLVDSDLILHPKTLNQLINSQKDIISEIFWTKWTPDGPLLPQVWLCDEYDLIPCESKKATENEKFEMYKMFIEQLKRPGIYKVGGLGACTLISKKAISKGVSFDKIYNLSFWGEDRHFCIRAVSLGFELYVDTHFPALHLYRDSDIEKIADFISGFKVLS